MTTSKASCKEVSAFGGLMGLRQSCGLTKFFPPQRPLACKIRLEEPHPDEDIMLIYLDRQFPYPVYLRPDLSDIWPFGRVFESSSGLHGEFLTPDEMMLSLVHLGTNDDQALR